MPLFKGKSPTFANISSKLSQKTNELADSGLFYVFLLNLQLANWATPLGITPEPSCSLATGVGDSL
jgi:hypothetical protein